MERIIIILFVLIYQGYITKAQQTMTDPRDGEVYQIKTFQKSIGFDVIVTHTWMVENLRYETSEGSYFHKDLKTDGERKKYGRLYTWDAAKKACPTGWHLATDLEWQKLIHQFTQGGLTDDKGDKQAYQNLLENGSSEFDALLGGGRSRGGVFNYLGKDGGYWSATESLYYNFSKENDKIYRSKNNVYLGFSCRCVKD